MERASTDPVPGRQLLRTAALFVSEALANRLIMNGTDGAAEPAQIVGALETTARETREPRIDPQPAARNGTGRRGARQAAGSKPEPAAGPHAGPVRHPAMADAVAFQFLGGRNGHRVRGAARGGRPFAEGSAAGSGLHLLCVAAPGGPVLRPFRDRVSGSIGARLGRRPVLHRANRGAADSPGGRLVCGLHVPGAARVRLPGGGRAPLCPGNLRRRRRGVVSDPLARSRGAGATRRGSCSSRRWCGGCT